jgi:hypothetical protein
MGLAPVFMEPIRSLFGRAMVDFWKIAPETVRADTGFCLRHRRGFGCGGRVWEYFYSLFASSRLLIGG